MSGLGSGPSVGVTALTFSYRPEIWWDDAQYNQADRYIKWLCLANFCAFLRTEIYNIG